MQVKNEDIYIKQVIENVLDFCDEVIVTDNLSTDQTYNICEMIASRHTKVKLERIRHPREAASLLEPFFGTNTWIFGVDGDEIYDPQGLYKMRDRLLRGEYSNDWCIFGNVLNVISLDLKQKKARGYLAPPSRSMTKLYNFALIESWVNCPERLLGNEVIFKEGYHAGLRRLLNEEVVWEESDFRCLHMPFMKRSSVQKTIFINTRLNPDELEYINIQPSNFMKFVRKFELSFRQLIGKDWKNQKYRRGPRVEKDVSAFFLPEER